MNKKKMPEAFRIIGSILLILAPFLTFFLTLPLTTIYCDIWQSTNTWCGLGYVYVVGFVIFIVPALIGSVFIGMSLFWQKGKQMMSSKHKKSNSFMQVSSKRNLTILIILTLMLIGFAIFSTLKYLQFNNSAIFPKIDSDTFSLFQLIIIGLGLFVLSIFITKKILKLSGLNYYFATVYLTLSLIVLTLFVHGAIQDSTGKICGGFFEEQASCVEATLFPVMAAAPVVGAFLLSVTLIAYSVFGKKKKLTKKK